MNSWPNKYPTGSSYIDPEEHKKPVNPVDQELLKQKRYRSAYTTSQINYMEGIFKKHAYVDKTKRVHIAQLLNLPEKCIKVWFQNRRMKEKTSREEMGNGETEQKKPVSIFRGNPVLSTSERNSCSLPKPLEAPLEIPKKPCAHTKIFKPGVTEQGTPIKVMYPIYDFKQKSKSKEVVPKDNDDTKKQFRPNFYKDIPIDQNESSFYAEAQSPSPTVSTDSKSDYKASAEFSIDLCKKYREMFKSVKSEANDKFEKNNNQALPLSQPFPVIKPFQQETQDMPQDLSIKKKPSNYQDEAISLTHTPGNTSAVGPLFVDVNQTYYSPNGVNDSVITYAPSYNLLAIDQSAQSRNYYDTNNKYIRENSPYYEHNINAPPTVATKQAIPPTNKRVAPSNSFVPVRSMQSASSSQPIFSAAHSAPSSPTHRVGFAKHMGSAQYVSSLQNINSAHFMNPVQHTTSVEHMSSAQYTVKPQYALTIQHESPDADGNTCPYKLNWHRI